MEDKSLSILKNYWGYDSFRSLQADIIASIIAGKDTLALMPTGGGKSICFQVPAMQLAGICIVVSPLIALMKDQVGNLKKRGIEAVAIYSGMSKREVDIALDNCIFGNIKFLYLSPERLYSDLVRERMRHMKVNLFAIDEAHCISQWGYDFRPPYLLLSKLRELHPDVPFLALTATATLEVAEDIQEKLVFREKNVFRSSFRRPNLGYMALPEEDKLGRMMRMINKLGGSGVIYVRNRRETQEVARFLMNHGVSADFYHAGLDSIARSDKQDAWMQNKTRVIVATNAFGMGIDKPDVRFVLHLDIPDSLEAYYQEAGRAGRDGKKAFPVLMFDDDDRERLWDNFRVSFPLVKFIQQVYHQLGNYFQIAYGAGQGLSLNFDVVAFAKKYQLDVLATMSAIKFLERDGWISVSEPVFIPSRFKFEVDFKELYKFQVRSSKYDPLIKLILRNFGGCFDYFVAINEFDLGKRLRLPYLTVVEMLNGLQKLEIATYIPKTDAAQLEFLIPRVDYKNLFIDGAFIQQRKDVKEKQLRAIDVYLHTDRCRSIVLQNYFGEEETVDCGECDLCLMRKHKEKVGQNLRGKMRDELKAALANGPKQLKVLIDSLPLGDDKEKLALLRSLVDEEQIVVEGDLYAWNERLL